MNKDEETMAINRTGIQGVPSRTKDLLESLSDAEPSSAGDADLMAAERNTYVGAGLAVGHPPPAPAKEANDPAADVRNVLAVGVLVDKLGERLAFERSGVRLYDALIAKLDASGKLEGGPSRDELVDIRDDEQRHFKMVQKAIETLGGDPTVVTPSADLAAVKAMGLPQVLTDPRTTLAQGLEAILVAELVDNDGWTLLITLTEKLGYKVAAKQFREALQSEEEHLAKVRGWVERLTMNPAALLS
ncbi:ferritin-like domain-containing protein [Pendulispora rubella]|uniref:Ferritin-like domain-containing protein n=1 Tax=Pendulispora rubella TaxID=2741070 RepID=A0ABZ2L729_9BACT